MKSHESGTETPVAPVPMEDMSLDELTSEQVSGGYYGFSYALLSVLTGAGAVGAAVAEVLASQPLAASIAEGVVGTMAAVVSVTGGTDAITQYRRRHRANMEFDRRNIRRPHILPDY